MLLAIPLLIIPFVLYNLAMVGVLGGGGVEVLESQVMSLTMLSGANWTMKRSPRFIVQFAPESMVSDMTWLSSTSTPPPPSTPTMARL